jgi:HEAT repeat protein
MAGVDSFLIKELEFDLTSEDEGTRRNALLSLAKMEWTPALLERFRQVAAQDASPEIRYVAKKYFTQIRDKLRGEHQAAPIITPEGPNLEGLRAALSAEELEPRLEILRQLVQANAKVALPVLLETLKRETHEWMIATLVKAIGALGDESHLNVLQPYLKHPDVRVCANTVEALELCANDLAFPLLLPLLEHQDHRVQGNAVKALVKVDRPQALQALDRMADSPRDGVRDSALHCLELVAAADVEAVVRKLFRNESRSDLLKKIAQLLAQVGTRETLPDVCRHVRSHARERSALAKYVVKGITQRLQISAEELATIEASSAAEAHDQLTDSGGGARTSSPGMRRSTGRMKALGSGNYPRPTSRVQALEPEARTRPWPAWALAGAIGLGAIVVVLHARWQKIGLDPLPSGNVSVLVRAASAADPKDFLGRAVEFSGQVRARRTRELALVVACGNRLVAVTPAAGAAANAGLDQLNVGQTVAIKGRITGKSTFGGVYVEGGIQEARQ